MITAPLFIKPTRSAIASASRMFLRTSGAKSRDSSEPSGNAHCALDRSRAHPSEGSSSRRLCDEDRAPVRETTSAAGRPPPHPRTEHCCRHRAKDTARRLACAGTRMMCLLLDCLTRIPAMASFYLVSFGTKLIASDRCGLSQYVVTRQMEWSLSTLTDRPTPQTRLLSMRYCWFSSPAARRIQLRLS